MYAGYRYRWAKLAVGLGGVGFVVLCLPFLCCVCPLYALRLQHWDSLILCRFSLSLSPLLAVVFRFAWRRGGGMGVRGGHAPPVWKLMWHGHGIIELGAVIVVTSVATTRSAPSSAAAAAA